MSTPPLTLHVLPPSHPCKAVEAALAHKGLEFDRVEMTMGNHNEEMAAIYGSESRTVPGLLVGEEPVHGSVAIMERLDQLAPEPALYPEEIADGVREAERWGDEQLQDLGRRFPWGAMYFRPEYFGTFGGADPLDPAGTDFAMKFVRASWKYHGISCELLAADLAAFPEKLERIAGFAAAGVIGGSEPTAADLQIGSTLRVLLTIGDLRPLIEAGPGAEIAMRWFGDYPGEVPAGAFPAGWVPSG